MTLPINPDVIAAEMRVYAARIANNLAQTNVLGAATFGELQARTYDLNATAAELESAQQALITIQAIQNAAQAGVFGVNALNNLNNALDGAANTMYTSPSSGGYTPYGGNSYTSGMYSSTNSGGYTPNSENSSQNAAQDYAKRLYDPITDYTNQACNPLNAYTSGYASSPVGPHSSSPVGPHSSSPVARPKKISSVSTYTYTTTSRQQALGTNMPTNQNVSYPNEPRGSAGIAK